uniref:Uncharacterized protein LOC108041494 n=1 Tax=Drosophila rhopaloa TaxID=1041015 RepID=A0A6P4EIV7_DRORH
MQLLLLAFMLLLQQHPLLGGSQSQQKLAGLSDDGRSTTAALSDNLNSAPAPGKTIKAIERQMRAADEVASTPAANLQVTPANQVPASTPPTVLYAPKSATRSPESFMAATMATGNHSVQRQLKRTENAATLDAITAETAIPQAAGVSAAAATATVEATTPAISLTREQHMLLPRPTAARMARINVPATIEDQIGPAVIPSKINMAETPAAPTHPAAIMPARTKRTETGTGTEMANKSVDRAGIKFNTDAALSHGYVNATEAWPAMTTANIVAEPATSTISPALTSPATRISGKSVPTPRLLGAANAAQLLAKSLDSPSPPSSSGWPVKHAAVLEGDVILGGLMMVHSREDSITCGPIMPQGGIQALEAMLYTLDQVNKHQLLPNVTLGAHLLDDCDKDTYGLEMAVDFIK